MEYIFGALASLLVQWVKVKQGTNKWATMAFLLLVSLGAAGLYQWLYEKGLWEGFMQILITAGAVHNFILRRFEE